LIVIGQFALPVEMLLLVNKTFDLLQDGVVGRRFSHINHLADSLLSLCRIDGFIECSVPAAPFRSGRGGCASGSGFNGHSRVARSSDHSSR
jgi:hypothetical protein